MFPLRDTIRTTHVPVMVYAIILVNVAVFLYQTTLPAREAYVFSLKHALVPCRYFEPACAHFLGLSGSDYWPFITGAFMHGGWLHIILNMWTLFIFGRSLEGRLGSLPFILFYLVSGLAASGAHAFFNQASSVPALGASGAIAGVIGAYALTFPHARLLILVPIVIIPFFFEIPAVSFAIIWFLLQILQGALDLFAPSFGGGIAWWAHIGGFIAGVLLVPFFWGRREGPKDAPWGRGPWG